MFFEIVVERLRPVRELDRLRALIVGQIGVETEPVPELLGDEGHERMKEPQRVAEDEIDHRERVRFARA